LDCLIGGRERGNILKNQQRKMSHHQKIIGADVRLKPAGAREGPPSSTTRQSQQKTVCLSLYSIPSASNMHTLWVRLNAVVFFGLSALLGFSCLAALSKYNHSSKPGTFCFDVLLQTANRHFDLFLSHAKHIMVRFFTTRHQDAQIEQIKVAQAARGCGSGTAIF
jgi:hypothetical protein